jgi:DNA-binding FadR family transcriptional regulator
MVLAAELREQIVRGELPNGTALSVEEDLIKETSFSRFTVREALRLLEGEGLLEIRRGVGGGPRVRHPSIAPAAQAVGVQLQLRDVPVLDAWRARNDLVLAATDDLAAAGGPDDAAILREILDRLANFGDPDDFYRLWLTLTDEIVRLAGNATRYVLTLALHEITEAQLDAATHAADVDEAIAFRLFVIESCRGVVAAIVSHEGETARRLLKEQFDRQTEGQAILLGPATVIDIFQTSDAARRRLPVGQLRPGAALVRPESSFPTPRTLGRPSRT